MWHLTDSILLSHPKFKLKHWSQGCCWNWQFIWKRKYPCLKMDHPCTSVNSPVISIGWDWMCQGKRRGVGMVLKGCFYRGMGKINCTFGESWHVFILSFQPVSHSFQQFNHPILKQVQITGGDIEVLNPDKPFWQIPVHNSILGGIFCRNQCLILSILYLCFFHTKSRIRYV